MNNVLIDLRFDGGFTLDFYVITGKLLIIAAANSAMTFGLSLVNPVWDQNSSAYVITMQLIAFLTFASIIIPKRVFHVPWLQLPMAVVIGFAVLYMGYCKLCEME